MVNPSRIVCAAFCLAGLGGCTAHLPASETAPPPAALPVFVFVTNESGLPRRFELRVNDVVVLDTVVARPLDLTGRVLLDTVRLAPGNQQLVLVDHYRNRRITARLTVRPGPLCIFISLLGPRTDFRAGNYMCGFA
jgi:hypothetical protein